MAKHNVFFQLPTRELDGTDANFYIYKDDEKLGQITISKGSLEYYPARRKKPISITWSDFDELMRKFEKGE
jgi:hypothetical protein